MNLFYHPDAASSEIIEFTDEESRHIKVMRYNEGAMLHVTNGKGMLGEAKIISTKKNIKAEMINQQEHSLPLTRLSIAIAPTKNQDRLEWFVEKATELGIAEIILFTSSNSEKPRVNMLRLERIAIAAMKQSERFFLPQIVELCKFQQAVSMANQQQKFIAHCKVHRKRSLLKTCYLAHSPAIVLIGPEGDFTEEEIVESSVYGFVEVSLGNSRLRTETAGLAALLTFDILNQEST